MVEVGVTSKPPVSTRLNSVPCHETLANMRSRVVPGRSATIANGLPTSRLSRVDLPTFSPVVLFACASGSLPGQKLPIADYIKSPRSLPHHSGRVRGASLWHLLWLRLV